MIYIIILVVGIIIGYIFGYKRGSYDERIEMVYMSLDKKGLLK